MKAVLVTGGAGFVGAWMARLARRRWPSARIVALDNLKRRGSELNLENFRRANIEFVHGDIRNPSDLLSIGGHFDLMVEASAEPSVHAGVHGDTSYLLQTNLTGTLNCLDYARHHCGCLIFLSTSRVYSIPRLLDLPLVEEESRLSLGEVHADRFPGLSGSGISEDFTTRGYRSLYGATKLASELIIEEYAQGFGFPAVINRCAVIAGPGQWGKVDQGVFTLWVARHYMGKPLQYTGFGGTGKQVRDLLHPADLFELICLQIGQIDEVSGRVFNVGGGLDQSTSLLEYSELCREVTGNDLHVGSKPETESVDIPFYISDCTRAHEVFSWQPERGLRQIVEEIYGWLRKENERILQLF